MKIGCLIGALALLASMAAGEPEAPAQAQVWLDFSGADVAVPYEESFEISLPEFPGVTFCWTAYHVSAATEEGEQELFTGWPVENVYFCDLTGDGKPELCATVCYGFGLIDERILVYDYASGVCYELESRGQYDYRLSLEDGALTVVQTEAPFGEVAARGRLVLQDGALGISSEH